MPPNDVPRFLAAAIGQMHDETSVAYRNSRRLQRVMARIHEWLVIMCFGRMRRSCHQPHVAHLFAGESDWPCPMYFHVLDFRALPVLFQDPAFFEDFVELRVVSPGE